MNEYEYIKKLQMIIVEQAVEGFQLRSILREWVDATPRDRNGQLDPINQPQAWKAANYLEAKAKEKARE